MVHTVIYGDIIQFKGIYPFKTGNIKAILFRMRSALMMRVNTADRTKIMFRSMGIKLIKAEFVFTFYDGDAIERNRSHNRPTSATHRAITASGVN
ncbi:hypothetical protein KY46_13935 [Photobacterium halotolerans]|uniref:Uncharacterized protein n=1 Tax=Photobacterium halotolerans TaxID=265726 RepID=A0A0F5VAQ0_9GAMM|nr:hypothetical protein KY46_13935 [Photobacterium halotolerans]